MPLPLVALAAGLAAKGVGSLLKRRAAGKQRKEEEKQAKEVYERDKLVHGEREGGRARSNTAAQAMLRTLFGGRYAVPEDLVAGSNVSRTYGGPMASQLVRQFREPSRGSATGDFLSAAGGAVTDYGLGGMAGGGSLFGGRGGGEAAGPPTSMIQGGSYGGVPYPDPYA